jgi:hypothetical protein
MPIDNMDAYEIANLQNIYFNGENGNNLGGFRRDSVFGGYAARNNSMLSTLESHHHYVSG